MQRNHDEFNRKHVNDRLNDKNSDFGNNENLGDFDFHFESHGGGAIPLIFSLIWMLA